MQTYTFIKERHECGNIEGCKFVGDIFRTSDNDVAERLRKSYTFNKTVREINEDKVSKPQSDGYDRLSYSDIVSMCKDRGLNGSGKRAEILSRLRAYDNERK